MNKKKRGFWDYILYPGMIFLILMLVKFIFMIYKGTI